MLDLFTVSWNDSWWWTVLYWRLFGDPSGSSFNPNFKTSPEFLKSPWASVFVKVFVLCPLIDEIKSPSLIPRWAALLPGLTLDILNGWFWSTPPCIRNPQGAPPSSRTSLVVISFAGLEVRRYPNAVFWNCSTSSTSTPNVATLSSFLGTPPTGRIFHGKVINRDVLMFRIRLSDVSSLWRARATLDFARPVIDQNRRSAFRWF